MLLFLTHLITAIAIVFLIGISPLLLRCALKAGIVAVVAVVAVASFVWD